MFQMHALIVLFILLCLWFPSLFPRPLDFKIFNSAGMTSFSNMSITQQVSETPFQKIAFSHNLASNLKDFNYIICGNNINDYLVNTNEWGTCQQNYLNQFFAFFNSTYYEINDVFGNTHGSWAVNQTTIVSLGQEHYGFVLAPGWFELGNTSIKYFFDEVIQIAHAHARDHFGHFLSDCLIPMLLLPEEVLQNSYVLGASYPPFINDGFQTIGIPINHIINADFSEWFYAKKIHTFAGKRPSLSFYGFSCFNFNQLMRKKLKLNEIPATKYFLQNRNQGNFRYIGNFDELFSALKKQIPSIRWLILPDKSLEMAQTAKIWATARFVCTTTGSNALKAVFMKPESVVVLAMANTLEKSAFGIIASSRHYVVLYPVPGMEQFSRDINKAWMMDISIAIEAIKKGLRIDNKLSNISAEL